MPKKKENQNAKIAKHNFNVKGKNKKPENNLYNYYNR